jgi:hypothetical protein
VYIEKALLPVTRYLPVESLAKPVHNPIPAGPAVACVTTLAFDPNAFEEVIVTV